MKIYAPVENINGIYASVMFVNSVGETDNPALIEWFRSHGYRIERESTVSLEEIVPIVPDAPTWEVGGNESVEETKEDTVVDKKMPVATEYDNRYLTLKQVEVLQRVNL